MKTKTKEIQLDETIGSIEPSRLEGTRARVIAEARAKVSASEVKVIEVADKSKKPGTTTLSMLHEQNDELAKENDKRTEKLDMITDIQLILVDRFQGLYRTMIAALVVMGLCLVAMVGGLNFGLTLRDQIAGLVKAQSSMLKRQEKLAANAAAIEKSVEATQKSVENTEKSVKEVAEKVPEVQIDPVTGKTTVLLQTAKPKKHDPPTPNESAPPKPRPKHPPAPSGKIRVPITDLR